MKNRFKLTIYYILILISVACPRPVEIRAQKTAAQVLDGVLSGMGGADEFDFDSLLSSMEGGKNEGDIISAVADVMTAYADVNYNYPALYRGNSYYSNSGQYYHQPNRNSFKYNIHGGAILPVKGQLTSGFGYRPRFGRNHKGVDIALCIGDTVRAVMDGVVERVSNDPKGYGLFVCIRHDNGLETRYGHLSKIIAVEGFRILSGEPVGLGGSTGNSTGPHLHFETRINGLACDPTTMFDFTNPANRTLISTGSLARLDYMGGDPYSFGSGSVKVSRSDNVEQAARRSTYVVKAGDTIGSVASKNGISVLTLCRLNMLSSTETLTPGRMLKLR